MIQTAGYQTIPHGHGRGYRSHILAEGKWTVWHGTTRQGAIPPHVYWRQAPTQAYHMGADPLPLAVLWHTISAPSKWQHLGWASPPTLLWSPDQEEHLRAARHGNALRTTDVPDVHAGPITHARPAATLAVAQRGQQSPKWVVCMFSPANAHIAVCNPKRLPGPEAVIGVADCAPQGAAGGRRPRPPVPSPPRGQSQDGETGGVAGDSAPRGPGAPAGSPDHGIPLAAGLPRTAVEGQARPPSQCLALARVDTGGCAARHSPRPRTRTHAEGPSARWPPAACWRRTWSHWPASPATQRRRAPSASRYPSPGKGGHGTQKIPPICRQGLHKWNDARAPGVAGLRLPEGHGRQNGGHDPHAPPVEATGGHLPGQRAPPAMIPPGERLCPWQVIRSDHFPVHLAQAGLHDTAGHAAVPTPYSHKEGRLLPYECEAAPVQRRLRAAVTAAQEEPSLAPWLGPAEQHSYGSMPAAAVDKVFEHLHAVRHGGAPTALPGGVGRGRKGTPSRAGNGSGRRFSGMTPYGSVRTSGLPGEHGPASHPLRGGASAYGGAAGCIARVLPGHARQAAGGAREASSRAEGGHHQLRALLAADRMRASQDCWQRLAQDIVQQSKAVEGDIEVEAPGPSGLPNVRVPNTQTHLTKAHNMLSAVRAFWRELYDKRPFDLPGFQAVLSCHVSRVPQGAWAQVQQYCMQHLRSRLTRPHL